MATEPFIHKQTTEQTPLGAVWRYRWLVLLLTLLGGALAFIYASGTDRADYQATASLVVTDPRASTLFSSSDVAGNAALYVEDQVAILRSDLVAQRTSELIAVEEPPIVIEATDIAFTVQIFTTDGNEILVQYAAPSSVTAVTTVNAVIEAYEQVRREEAVRDSASAIDQLDQSIANIDAELQDIEAQILVVRQSPDQELLDAQYAQAIDRVVEIQPLLVTATEEELVVLRAELDDIDRLLTRRSQIAASEEGNPLLIQLYGEQAEAIGRRSTLAEQRDRLLVDTELLSGGISLASPAQFAVETRRDVTTVTILGSVLGFLVGASFAYLLAIRRRKFDERAQPGWVLGTSLLAEVPVFGDEGIRSELPVLEHPGSASAEAFRFASTALELRTPKTEDQPTQLHRQPRIYLITSPGPQEGKTVVTANLALAAARKGRNVLAIDADFGNQRLSELLRDEPAAGPGITDVVETGLNLASATFSLGPPGPLDLLSRGERPTNAPNFFGLPATEAFIAKTATFYDLVLIDGPPMLHIAYASILAQYVEKVIVVTRHGGSVTRLEDLAQRLDLISTPLAGYIYNGAPLRYEMTLTEGSLQDILGERG